MTEAELNERIAELQENDLEAAHQRKKDSHRLRQIVGVRKTDNLLRIINYGGYAPHRGYIDRGFDGKTLPLFVALYAISVRQARVLPIERPFNFRNPAFFRFYLTVDTLAFG